MIVIISFNHKSFAESFAAGTSYARLRAIERILRQMQKQPCRLTQALRRRVERTHETRPAIHIQETRQTCDHTFSLSPSPLFIS
ncbi:hypothetical protein Lepto1489_15680 [Leptospira interrogans serovar Bataviae]|uniref:Uncharacterized protein n=1 Tax=Leptospira interrogans serovar Bataviae TaxID=312175 RepID=A0AAQ0B313_LEPIR|nr:hypothetical protein Lepto1489_15680 [Leptospira interrogans serovar Bataviae]